jgi:hypothetical protein
MSQNKNQKSMNIRPYTQFYKSIFPFVAGFAFVGVMVFGVFWGFFFFVTIALGFGFVGFNTFKKNEWYTYQNLGITKWMLFKGSFFMNLVLGLPVFIFLFLLISFIIGDFSLT